jgi:hypothetical protein
LKKSEEMMLAPKLMHLLTFQAFPSSTSAKFPLLHSFVYHIKRAADEILLFWFTVLYLYSIQPANTIKFIMHKI